MKRRRHVLGGLLMVAVAGVLAASDWAVLDERVLLPLALGFALVGIANVLVGVGRPAALRSRREPVTAVTALLFAALATAIAIENVLAPDGPVSYLLAGLWGAAALVTGWLGVDRLRSRG